MTNAKLGKYAPKSKPLVRARNEQSDLRIHLFLTTQNSENMNYFLHFVFSWINEGFARMHNKNSASFW